MKIKFEWEKISVIADDGGWETIWRAKVIWGWMVKYEHEYKYPFRETFSPYRKVIFIFDPNHEWEIDNDENKV